jgi:hypothetical protein
VHNELKRTLRKGARASRLARYSRSLVELLFPAGSSELNLPDRAIAVEQVIREAIASIGGRSGEALAILLCLKPGTLDLNLEQRRQQAAELLNILPDTFRRERHEGLMIWDLAWEVYGQSRPPTI